MDGGFGTMIMKAGLPAGEVSEIANASLPNQVREIHAAYIRAGARIITTNTFGGNRVKLAEFGLDDRMEELNAAGVRLAAEARDHALETAARDDVQGSGAPFRALVGASMGPTGSLMAPFGSMNFEEAEEIFSQQAGICAAAGADLFILETFSDLCELKAAVAGVRRVSDLPIVATMTFTAGGHTLTGSSPTAAAAAMSSLDVDAVGMNCGFGPRELKAMFEAMAGGFSLKPLVIQANAGIPKVRNGATVYDLSPAEFARAAAEFESASLVGGCCGTTPEHIEALGKALEARPARETRAPVRRGFLCGTTKVSFFGSGAPFLAIGEKINPTGRKKLTAQFRAGETTAAREMAMAQELAGASAIDVNVSVPGIDERAMMEKAVTAVTNVSGLPVVIDTRNRDAMKAALGVVRGRPLLNSFNGEPSEIDEGLACARKYGAAVMFLTMDESGIPDLKGRLAIADRIMNRALETGFPLDSLVIDPLCLPVSADPAGAADTLKALRSIRDKWGVATTLGISNVSFGLPGREEVNRAFLGLAMGNGLDMGIVNPLDPRLMASILISDTLAREAREPMAFVRFHERAIKPLVPGEEGPGGAMGPKGEPSCGSDGPPRTEELLKMAICHGDREGAAKLLSRALEGHVGTPAIEPAVLVNETVIPAITEVGDSFGEGRTFLPQLIASAEVVRTCMEILEPLLLSSGTGSKAGTMVLATVRGDVHDIGKNIVGLVLRNHGIQVVDLGKDVPASRVLEAIEIQRPGMVGLSALMTTTMSAMADTVASIRKGFPNLPVVVGGACVDREFAESIGAHFASDAVEAVKIFKKFAGSA